MLRIGRMNYRLRSQGAIRLTRLGVTRGTASTPKTRYANSYDILQYDSLHFDIRQGADTLAS